jgi:phosphoglycolate phosphatase
MTKAIVFDLDGTLADSSSCIVDATHLVSKELGLAFPSEVSIRQKIGQPLAHMLATLLDISGDLVPTAVQIYSTEYVRLAKTEERLFEGTIPLLQSLRKTDYKLAIATGKSQRGAEHSTSRLGIQPWFDSIHGILPGTPGKPAPDVLLRAMHALNVSADECIMIGDTTFDIDLAQAIKVQTIAVDWGVHSKEKLMSRTPNHFVSNFAELEVLLHSLYE